jgi:NADH-quinone oxidoreductase subunit H
MMETLFTQLKAICMIPLAAILPAGLLPYASWLVNIIALLIFAPVTMMYMTWLERKLIGRIQDRYGPNRVGKFGLLQPIADGIKMLLKEDIVPRKADALLHGLAPVIVVTLSLLVFAVIPFGKGMIAIDLNLALFFFIAISSVHTIPIFMAGWGSHNKFSLLGALRAVAQAVSYEVPLAVSVIVVLIAAQTFSTVGIVEAQTGANGMSWFVFTPWGFLGFLLFFIGGVAEVNRTPFDLPEGESELVAGFHTEYSGMKFALLYMGEFLSTFAIAAFAATLFLGGWNGPWLPSWMWFFIKTYGLIFVMIWMRGTLPRLRADQLMAFAWKFLLPLSMINVLAAALWFLLPRTAAWPVTLALVIGSWIAFSNVRFTESNEPVKFALTPK